jgi:hypothetical protein
LYLNDIYSMQHRINYSHDGAELDVKNSMD